MEAVKRVHPQAAQLSSVYQLGNLCVEYTDRLVWIGLALIVFLPVGLIFLAMALPLLFSSQGDWLYRLEQVSNLLPLLLWGSGFLLLSLVGLVIVIVKLWRGRKRVYLFEYGVVYARRQIEVAARWDEVQEIRRHIFFVKNKLNNAQQAKFISSYTIVTTGGSPYSVLEDPGPAIERAVTDSLWPAALEEFAAGKLVAFGWLTLDRRGIHLTPTRFAGDHAPALANLPGIARIAHRVQGTGMALTSDERVLPWNELELCWVDETRSSLVISKREERSHWAIAPLWQVSNAALFLALVKHVLYGGGYHSD